MEEIARVLEELNIFSITLRLIMSILFAGIIGFERQRQHHPAGLRTHILVCMGSTMTMMLGQYMAELYGSDPSRIGAQVVSGIGFLGVGTIILSGGRVKGITTASGLWACACMGLMIGAGFYLGACLSFVFVLFTLLVMRSFNNIYNKKHPRRKRISAYLRDLSDLTYVVKLLRVWGASINEANVDYSENKKETIYYQNGVRIVVDITLRDNMDSAMVMANLLQEDCIIYADYVDPEESAGKDESEEL